MSHEHDHQRDIPPGMAEQLDLAHAGLVSFGHRPFLTEVEQLESWRPDVSDRRGSVRHLDDQPAGGPVRSTRHPGHRIRARHLPPGSGSGDLRLAGGHRLRGCVLSARPDRGLPCQHPRACARGRVSRHRPCHPRRRPLDHLAGGHRGGRCAWLRQCRDRPLRRPRRHRRRNRGQLGQPRHPDAAAHRVGRGARDPFRPGRAARLLATAGHVRVDARAGHDVAHDAGDLGTRIQGRHA